MISADSRMLSAPVASPPDRTKEKRWSAVNCRDAFRAKNIVAPRHGFEPRFTAPKAAVLPLDDRGTPSRRVRRSSVYHADRGRSDGHHSEYGVPSRLF